MVVALQWQVRWTEVMSSNVGGSLVVGIGSKREVISSTVRDSWALDAMETELIACIERSSARERMQAVSLHVDKDHAIKLMSVMMLLLCIRRA